MRNQNAILTIIVGISVIMIVLIYQQRLHISFDYMSPRLSDSKIYGKGCHENPFYKRLQTLFRAWLTVSSRRNITYFVCYGSLLGLHRDGEVVPYDHDLDVCIFRKELYKLELEDEVKPFTPDDGKTHLIYQKHCHHPKPDTPRKTCEGVEVTKEVDQCTFLDPCARIVLRPPTSGRTTWIDVFALHDTKGAMLKDDWKYKTVQRDIIFPLKPCTFMGMQTMCPNNIVGYLTKYYGSDFLKSHYVCKNGEWVPTGKEVTPISVPRCPEKNIVCKADVFLRGVKNNIQF